MEYYLILRVQLLIMAEVAEVAVRVRLQDLQEDSEEADEAVAMQRIAPNA